jgi:hypothetical protein
MFLTLASLFSPNFLFILVFGFYFYNQWIFVDVTVGSSDH